MKVQKIDATLSDTATKAINRNIDEIDAALSPFRVSLTLTERRSKGRGGDKSRAFILHAAKFAAQNSGVLKRNFDDAGYQRRITLLTALEELSAKLGRLLESLNDTILELRSQVYKESLSVYKDAKDAGKDGSFDEALAELGRPFDRQGPKKDPEPSK